MSSVYQFPMGKVKMTKKTKTSFFSSYQFPMGKVKGVPLHKNYEGQRVSIPYGKGKDDIMQQGDLVGFEYQFPMGKVKLQKSYAFC